MKRLTVIHLLFLFSIGVLHSEPFDKVGTTTAQFLKLGIGAKSMGMGGAFVALADDGSAAYWNPAGLWASNDRRIQFNHQNWLLDITQEYVSIQLPVNHSTTAGLSISTLLMDEKEITTVTDPDGNGLTYSVMDMAICGSIARKVSDRLRYGANIKYIQSTAHNEMASTFAFDIGSIFLTEFYGLSMGMALSNFGAEMQYVGTDLIQKSDIDEGHPGNAETDANLRTESWPIPLLIRMGVAMDIMGKENTLIISNSQRLTVALDAVHPNDAREHLILGCEYNLFDLIYLRSGYRFNYDLDKLTFGAGFQLDTHSFGKIMVNYAIHPMGVFGQTNQVSIEITY